MTRVEAKLHATADRHWPGSCDHLRAVYRAHPDLFVATMISVMLTSPATRRDGLAAIRQKIPRSTRPGPKADRIAAALVALDRLDEMATAT